MCGICGYTQKENIISPSIINKMKDSIMNIGKLESNVYIKNNVALGNASPNRGQPLTRIIDQINYTIVYNGNLYNRNLLKNILITRGYSFETDSEAEILLLLYTCFKEEMLKFINGIFSFAIYNEQDSSIFIARDRLGIKPLFYIVADDKFIFSSQIKGILSSSFVSPIMTKNEILELFSLGPAHTPGKTYFKNIFEVKAGYYGIYKDSVFTTKCYWDLEEKKLYDSDDEIIDNVRYLVNDSTKKQLLSDNGISCMLSGGLDSSILTKITSDFVPELNTYSIDYENNDENFKSNSYQLTKDSDFVKIMVKYLNTNHHNIILNDTSLFKSLEEAVIARDMPGMADIDSSMYLFCTEIEKTGTKTILSGECSDEIFGGYPWFYKEHLSNSKGFPWALSENLRENIVKPNILENNEITNYIINSKSNTLANIDHISSDSFEIKFKEINYLTIKYFMNTLIERTDRMSMRSSLEVRVPYADHRIFEYVYNVDSKLKLGIRSLNSNVNEKYILKEAFKSDLPSDIINRKKSPFPKTYSKEYLLLLENRLLEILNNKDSRILEIINKEFVLDLIKTHGSELKENLFGQLMTYPQTIAFLIQIDFWLTAYNVKIEL